MNSYTTDEVNILLKSITSEYDGFRTVVLNINIGAISFNHFMFFVFTDPNLDPFELHIYNNKSIENSVKGRLRDIRKLVYEEPLYRVPLYINIYPDVVSWRLELGK